VQLETAVIEILEPKLSAWLNLTAADRKWMDEIVNTVTDSWNPDEPGRVLGDKFVRFFTQLLMEFHS
jgi:hypothetical protein